MLLKFFVIEITNAKREKLDKKKHNVYDTVDNIDHKLINIKLVLSEKYVNEKDKIS